LEAGTPPGRDRNEREFGKERTRQKGADSLFRERVLKQVVKGVRTKSGGEGVPLQKNCPNRRLQKEGVTNGWWATKKKNTNLGIGEQSKGGVIPSLR